MVHAVDLFPHPVEQVGADLLRGQLVQRPPVDEADREGHRAIGQRGQTAQGRARDLGATGHEQQQRLVLDVLLERHRRPVVVRAAEERGPVAAVQEVGVAAVAGVHLDEGAIAAVERRGVELGATSVGARELEDVDREAAVARTRPTTASGVGRRFGAPSATSTAAPATTPTATANSSSGTPAVPATVSTTISTSRPRSAHRRHERPSHGLPAVTTATAPATYTREGKSVPATQVPSSTAPRHLAVDIEEGIHQREQRDAGGRRERYHTEASPSLPPQERDHDPGRNRHGRELRHREQELAGFLRHRGRGSTEVGADPAAGRGRELDEEEEEQRRRRRQHEADDVAGVAEVAVARRDGRGGGWRTLDGHDLDVDTDRLCHVVPSLVTAATTRSRSTVPASRPK